MKKHCFSSQTDFFICVFSFFLLSFPSLLFSEELYSHDEGIISVGISEVIENDLVSARERSIEDAQKKAMVQAVANEIPSKMMEDNYRTLNERLYQQNQRFIESFKIITEVPQGDFYKITIQCTLAQDDIRNELKRLGITKQLRRPPRVMLMIAERDIGQKNYTYWWSYENLAPSLTFSESILKNKLQERGIYVVDHISLAKENFQNKKYNRDVNLPEVAIREYGKEFDVDVVINGTVDIETINSQGDSGVKSVQANIAAKALQVEDGKVLMAASYHAPALSTDEAAAKREALKKAIGRLLDQMTDLILKQGKGKTDFKIIFLKVIGLQSFSEFLRLKEEIKRRIPEVQEIYQRGIFPENSQIDVETKLDASTFIKVLISRGLESFNLQMLSISHAFIELEVFPKTLSPSLKSIP